MKIRYYLRKYKLKIGFFNLYIKFIETRALIK